MVSIKGTKISFYNREKLFNGNIFDDVTWYVRCRAPGDEISPERWYSGSRGTHVVLIPDKDGRQHTDVGRVTNRVCTRTVMKEELTFLYLIIIDRKQSTKDTHSVTRFPTPTYVSKKKCVETLCPWTVYPFDFVFRQVIEGFRYTECTVSTLNLGSRRCQTSDW